MNATHDEETSRVLAELLETATELGKLGLMQDPSIETLASIHELESDRDVNNLKAYSTVEELISSLNR